MHDLLPRPSYRSDIDGLRAIAVIAVILFHFGLLPAGYLGVDIFFVISGFLITGIIHREVSENRFSIVNFYLRRTRRILPLVSLICVVALLLGWLTMLPDDLENLSQSVIATNFFGNNILQAITTRNYWDVANDYKPLMHTWSLAVEEQYYLIYPFLFLLFRGPRARWILPCLVVLSVGSLAACFLQPAEFKKFYYLPYRFYELAAGGILAISLGGRMVSYRLSFLPVVALLLLVFLPLSLPLNEDIRLALTILTSVAFMATANESSGLLRRTLMNPVVVYVGKISFSLYMWHQLLLAFARYFVFEEMDATSLTLVAGATLGLSVLSYHLVENPFRNRKVISTPWVLTTVIAAFLGTTLVSAAIYRNAGVVRDVPELGIVKADAQRGMHARYNAKVRGLDMPFTEDGREKVLVVGDSFARDWVNVLLESDFSDEIEVSYIFHPDNPNLAERIAQADIVFYARAPRGREFHFPEGLTKLWLIGNKSFGSSSGYFYNNRSGDYRGQRARVASRHHVWNEVLRGESNGQFIDILDVLEDENGAVPVFTDDGRLISQDTRHLTSFGARYMAKVLREKIASILFADGPRPTAP